MAQKVTRGVRGVVWIGFLLFSLFFVTTDMSQALMLK